MQNWWEQYPQADSVAPSSFGQRPVYQEGPPQPSPQTPAQAQKDAYDAGAKPTYDRFGAIDKIRDGYRQDKRILKYEEAIPIYVSAIKSPDDAAGDNLLVNAVAKVSDPTTGVQQREGASWEDTQANFEAMKARMLKEFGTDGSGNFTPQARLRIRNALTVRMKALAEQYAHARTEYKQYLRQARIPDTQFDAVFGPHVGLPYKGQIQEWLDTVQGDSPRINDQTKEGFDLQQDPSIASMTPEQTAAYQAWWKANPNPSPDQLNQFFVAVGLGPAPNAQDIIAAAKEGRGISTTIENQIPQHIQERLDQRLGNAGDGGAAVAGGADTITMGTFDELSALGDAVGDAFQGQGFDYSANLAANRQFQEGLQDQHGGAYLGGQIAGAAIMPTFGAKSVPQFVGLGAGYGGAYGAGSGEGNIGDRAVSAFQGSATGAATAGVLGYGGQKLFEGGRRVATAAGRRLAGPTTPEQAALLKAGEREGVPVNMGDVYPNLRNTIATQETIPGSSGPIRQGIQAGRDAMESRVGELGHGGTARGEGALGERVYKGGERYLAQHRAISERDYNIARHLAGADFKATADTAAAEANKIVAALSETPNSNKTVLGLYRDILADLTDNAGNLKPLSIDAIKEMRRNIRLEMSSRGLVGSKDDARLQAIVDAASSDVARALAAKDPRAAAAYQKADAAYAERIEFINGTLRNFMGTKDKPISGEALVAKIGGMAGSGARGNARELNRFMSVLSPEERADVAASFAAQLGRRSADEPFSPATFLSNIRNIDERSRIVLFGKSGAQSIRNLTKLATAKTESVNRLNNSRSGMVVNYRTVLSNLLLGVPGGGAVAGAATGIGGPTTAAVGLTASGLMLAGSRALAKALMNEDFTRAVAQTPATTSPKAINAHIGRLRQIAAKDPNVRAVVTEIERKLFSFANDNAGSSVAAESVGDDQQGR